MQRVPCSSRSRVPRPRSLNSSTSHLLNRYLPASNLQPPTSYFLASQFFTGSSGYFLVYGFSMNNAQYGDVLSGHPEHNSVISYPEFPIPFEGSEQGLAIYFRMHNQAFFYGSFNDGPVPGVDPGKIDFLDVRMIAQPITGFYDHVSSWERVPDSFSVPSLASAKNAR